MTTPTRKLLCRITFVALCVLPTVGLCGWVAVTPNPLWWDAQRIAWQDELSRSWGLIVEIGSAKAGDVGGALLEDVVIRDPESGDELARITAVEFVERDDRTVVVLTTPTARASIVGKLWQKVEDRLLLRGKLESRPLEIATSNLTLTASDAAAARTLDDVRVRYLPQQDGHRLDMRFRVAGQSSSALSEVELFRDLSGDTPQTRWSLRTDTPLNLSLFADYLPALERLGKECLFQGEIRGEANREGFDGEVVGTFQEIDLYYLLNDFPHVVDGRATLNVQLAKFHKGKLVSASGDVVGSSGYISNALVMQMASSMGLGNGPVGPPHGNTEYRGMHFGFRLDDQGLAIAGKCDNRGTLLASANGPLLSTLSTQPRSVVQLVHALAPDQEIQVPASQQTEMLLRWVPIPKLRTPTPYSGGNPRIGLEPALPRRE